MTATAPPRCHLLRTSGMRGLRVVIRKAAPQIDLTPTSGEAITSWDGDGEH
jgi:hypothetical protein